MGHPWLRFARTDGGDRLLDGRRATGVTIRVRTQQGGLRKPEPPADSPESVMQLQCPICKGSIDSRDLRRKAGTGGGYECPECNQMVRFSQPHALFRRLVSLVISILTVRVVGIRSIPWLLAGSLLLWVRCV